MRLGSIVPGLAGSLIFAAFLWAPVAEAQQAHFGGSERTIGTGYGSNAVAVDGAGNVYIADFDDGTIEMFAAVNGVQPATPVETTIATGLTHPNGLAFDRNGNLYVASAGNVYSGGSVAGSVEEIAAVSGAVPQGAAPKVLLGGLQAAVSVAVDASGNVYVADRDASAVEEIPAVNGTVVAGTVARKLGNGFSAPLGVAVDTVGNVYVADTGNSAVKKIAASNGAVTTVGSGFVAPSDVAVDTSGNVFVTDQGLRGVREIAASNGAIYTIGSGFYQPYGIAVDAREHVFVADESLTILSLGATQFGTLYVGQSSDPIALTFSFSAATTLGSTPYSVLTEGALNLGFAASSTQAVDACVAKSYNAGDTCTVTVTFTPVKVGNRPGAVVLSDAGGGAIATAYIDGVGLAAIASFGFTSPILVAPASDNLTQPIGMTVDGNRNVYTVSGLNGMLLKETNNAGAYTESVVRSDLSGPRAVAVDGAGNLYVTNTLANPNTILKETLNRNGTYTESVVLDGGMYYASGIGIDGSGNIFVGNEGPPDGTAGYILELTPQVDGSYASATILSNLASPFGISVDTSGSVYWGETVSTNAGNNRVLKGTPGSGGAYTQTVVATGLDEPDGVTVDADGSVYVADTSSGKILQYSPQPDGTYIPGKATSGGLTLPYGIAVDSNGSIYVSDNTPRIIRVDLLTDGPTLSFPDTVIGQESAPQTVTLSNAGNTPGILYNYNLDPIFAPSTLPPGTLCTDLATLDPGQSCLIPLTFNPIVVGPYTGTLVLDDNSLNAPVTAPATQTVTLTGTGLIAPTATTLLVNPALTIAFGTPATLTASVAPNKVGSTQATGTVTFYNGSTAAGTATLANGTATLPVSLALPVGTYNLTAVYAGDNNFATSTSPVVVATVVPASETVTLSSSSIVAQYGQSFTLTALLSDTTSTGTFQFYEITGGPHTPIGAAVTVVNGAGTVAVPLPAAGTHIYQVHYSGDTSHQAADSGSLPHQVVPAPLTVTATDASRNFGEANPAFTYTIMGFVNGDSQGVVSGAPRLLTRATAYSSAGTYPITPIQGTLSASNYTFNFVPGTLTINKITSIVTLASSQNPSFHGDAVTFTATVPLTATGTVNFMDGNTTLGSSPVRFETAVLTTSTLAGGIHQITAVYTGDASYNSASSPVVNQVVSKRIPPVNATVTGDTVVGQPATLTAIVPADATGTVTFYNGTTALGTATVVNGVATLATPPLVVGTYTITAVYSGDDNYTRGVSLPFVVNVVNPVTADFAIASGTGPQTIPPGASAAYTIQLTSAGVPFTDPVTLTATGLPQGASYTFSPASVVPGASGANSTLKVNVPGTTGMLRGGAAPTVLALVLLPLAWVRRRRCAVPRLLLGLMALATLVGVTGCGVGGYFNQTQQTYTITVTGTSGSTSHSTTVTLVVE